MTSADHLGPARRSTGVPAHLVDWQLPPGWKWGEGGLHVNHRHVQEIVDSFDRSLALVTAPDPAHTNWLFSEAKVLALRNHPAIPTTYHYWIQTPGSRRGPGYLRRWITGETVGARVRRLGTETIPYMLRVLRAAGGAIAYLHDAGGVHGAVSPDSIYVTPTGRVWLLGWPWAVPRATLPAGVRPDPAWFPQPAEWAPGAWEPSTSTDQWQLAATCFHILTGELPPRTESPPMRWARPDCPGAVAELLDRALSSKAADRFHSVASLLRAIDKISSSGGSEFSGVDISSGEYPAISEEQRLRWATGDDYEVLSSLGSGTFGSVWRVRDLTLQREVALKMLHPNVAKSDEAVARFRKEAQLAARLQHPAIVPIYGWDQKGGVHWYIMSLEDEGSVADLVRRLGPRPIAEVAPQVEAILEGLDAAHQNGIVHRDLKPENILLDRYRHWRIADFGIATALGDEVPGTSGTPSFAPPEQLLGEAQGATADLFAVGGITYFALTGKPPFDGTDGRSILAAQLAGRVDLSVVPEALKAWFECALSSDAEKRFPDAATMQRAWRSAAAEAVQDASPPSVGQRVSRAVKSLFG